jgi:HEAT repeat protein
MPLPEAYLRRVRECDLFVLIVGTNLSPPVIAEYETALSTRKPILAFLRRGERSREAVAFVQRVREAGAFKYASFVGPEDVVGLVVEALWQELADRFREYWLAVNEGHIPPPDVDRVIQTYAAEIIADQLFVQWQERYTPLRAIADLPLRYQAQDRRAGRLSEGPTRQAYRDLREALRDYRGVALVGEPGAGKTTSLQRLALDYAAAILRGETSLVPIYLPLGGYQPARSLGTYLADQLKIATLETPDGPQPAHAHRCLSDYLEALRRGHRLLFLLDGLNELRLADRGQALEEVGGFIKAALGDGCQVLVTCRADDYTEIGRLEDLAQVRVQELDDPGIEFFLRAHQGDRAADLREKLRDDSHGLLELARNPYRLWMIQAVYAEYGELPSNRAILFQRMVDWLLGRQKEVCQRQDPEAWFDADVMRAVLAQLAYAMLSDRAIFTVAPLDWVDRQLNGRIQVKGRWRDYDPERVLALARAARLTVEIEPPLERREEPGTLRFAHQLLQEYFAALRLNDLGLDHPEVVDCLRYDAWDETVVLLAGLTPHMDRLLEHLIPLEPFLAARCAGLRPEAVSPGVASRLTEVLVRLAEDFHNPSRGRAIAALGNARLVDGLPPLVRLLESGPAAISHAAARALGDSRGQGAVPALIKWLRDDEQSVRGPMEEIAREAAVLALEKLAAWEAVPALLEWSRDEEEDVRRVAVRTLGKLGAREAVPALMDLLRDEDGPVRQAAADSLARLEAREAIPVLTRRLLDGDEAVRHAAFEALAHLLTQHEIPAVVESPPDKDGSERLAAARRLSEPWSQDDTSAVVEFLRDEDENMRRVAAEALGNLGAQKAIPALMDRLGDDDGAVRQAVVEALGKLRAQVSVARLVALQSDRDGVEFLRDEDENMRRVTAEALGNLGAQEAIPALMDRLGDDDGAVRQAVVEALGKLRAQESVARLVALQSDRDGNVRWAAAMALRELGQADQAANMLLSLIFDPKVDPPRRIAATLAHGRPWNEKTHGLLLDYRRGLITEGELTDAGVDMIAFWALGELGASVTIPSLIDRLQDKEWLVREAAVEALGELEAQDVIPALIGRLRDAPADGRRAAVEALGKLQAREALPALIERLRDASADVRRASVEALGKLQAREAVPALIERLRDASANVRRAAVEALGKLQAREAVPALIERLRDKNKDVHLTTVETLAGLEVREAIPPLIQQLQNRDWSVREAAAEALGKLEAQGAIPALIERLRDDEEDVRSAAVRTLGNLDARAAIPALLLMTLEGLPGASKALTTLPSQGIMPTVRSLLAHPDSWVRQAAIPLYEEVRRKANLPREPEAAGLMSPLVSPAHGAEAAPSHAKRDALRAMIALADHALAVLPDRRLGILSKAEALRRLGCPAAALETLADLRSTAGGRREVVVQAQCLFDLGRREEALDLVRRVRGEAGDDTSLLSECASVLQQLDAAKDAEALYTRITKLEDWSGYRRNRAESYVRQGRYAHAQADLAYASRQEPWHPNTYGRQAQLDLARGMFAEALKGFREAARRDPHNVLWNYGAAFANLALGYGEHAKIALELALARTELHEEVEESLQDLALLERASLTLSGLSEMRQCLLARKVLLDRLAEQEYGKASQGDL